MKHIHSDPLYPLINELMKSKTTFSSFMYGIRWRLETVKQNNLITDLFHTEKDGRT